MIGTCDGGELGGEGGGEGERVVSPIPLMEILVTNCISYVIAMLL